MSLQPQLKVTSHVGRDLLAAAAAFKSEASVVWEYVVNSLQYVDQSVPPRVQVKIARDRKSISIADNGRGMSATDLEHFFRMHAVNRDRLTGRGGRGKFGTGKSAAFGIADILRIDTIKDRQRNIVSLTRAMIDESSGEDIPVNWEVKDKEVDESNGTTVFILNLNIDRIRTPSIIEYVERHLQAFRGSEPEVAIDNHVCSYRPPDTAESYEFLPSASQREVLGDVNLVVKVSAAPLPQPEQGVAVTAGSGNLVAIERAGVETKEFGNYLFGEIDVPALESYSSPIEPYDPTRSLQLNPRHPVVAILLGFVGSKLEEVRTALVKKAREARKTEESRRLAAEADKIAQILNDDFKEISERLNEIRTASARNGSAQAQFGARAADAGTEDWVQGTQQPGIIAQSDRRKHEPPMPRPDVPKPPPPQVRPHGFPDADGDNIVDGVGGDDGKLRRPRGGFRVVYRPLGKNGERSLYDPPTLTILINLDHPLVSAALGDGNVEDTTFRRLSYEIASVNMPWVWATRFRNKIQIFPLTTCSMKFDQH